MTFCTLLIRASLLAIIAKGGNDFNYDINDRVQDSIRTFLMAISEAGMVPFYQLQNGFIPLNMINGTEIGWDYGSALLFNTKRVYHNEMIAITLGEKIDHTTYGRYISLTIEFQLQGCGINISIRSLIQNTRTCTKIFHSINMRVEVHKKTIYSLRVAN